MVLGIAVAGAVLYNCAPVAHSMRPGTFGEVEVQEFLCGLHWAYIAGAGIAGAAAVTSLLAGGRKRQVVQPSAPFLSGGGDA
jgi:hypothetical protein